MLIIKKGLGEEYETLTSIVRDAQCVRTSACASTGAIATVNDIAPFGGAYSYFSD